MARKNVENPQKYNNAFAQKAYDMHHQSTRNSFCGIGYGAVQTTVDKKAAAVTGAVAATAVTAAVVTPHVPTWMQTTWCMIKSVFAPAKKP